MNNNEYIDNFLAQLQSALAATSRPEIESAIALLEKCRQERKQVFLIGNGGSAGTASHFACDLNQCTSIDGKLRLKAFSLVDNLPRVSALTNDQGFENIFVEQLKTYMNSGDVLIALSVHGGAGQDKAGPWSQNLLKAMLYTKQIGGKVIGFSGFDGGAMKDIADVSIVVPANSTPLVEAAHVALHHLIAFRLGELATAN